MSSGIAQRFGAVGTNSLDVHFEEIACDLWRKRYLWYAMGVKQPRHRPSGAQRISRCDVCVCVHTKIKPSGARHTPSAAGPLGSAEVPSMFLDFWVGHRGGGGKAVGRAPPCKFARCVGWRAGGCRRAETTVCARAELQRWHFGLLLWMWSDCQDKSLSQCTTG